MGVALRHGALKKVRKQRFHILCRVISLRLFVHYRLKVIYGDRIHFPVRYGVQFSPSNARRGLLGLGQILIIRSFPSVVIAPERGAFLPIRLRIGRISQSRSLCLKSALPSPLLMEHSSDALPVLYGINIGTSGPTAVQVFPRLTAVPCPFPRVFLVFVISCFVPHIGQNFAPGGRSRRHFRQTFSIIPISLHRLQKNVHLDARLCATSPPVSGIVEETIGRDFHGKNRLPRRYCKDAGTPQR